MFSCKVIEADAAESDCWLAQAVNSTMSENRRRLAFCLGSRNPSWTPILHPPCQTIPAWGPVRPASGRQNRENASRRAAAITTIATTATTTVLMAFFLVAHQNTTRQAATTAMATATGPRHHRHLTTMVLRRQWGRTSLLHHLTATTLHHHHHHHLQDLLQDLETRTVDDCTAFTRRFHQDRHLRLVQLAITRFHLLHTSTGCTMKITPRGT